MKLDTILALRPPSGASVADLFDALNRAVAARATFAGLVTKAEEAKQDVLAADDNIIAQADREATQAQRAVDRIDALLPLLRNDLAIAQGQQALVELRRDHAVMMKACQRLTAWQTGAYPQILDMVNEGFAAQAEAEAAIEAFKAGVVAAYARPEVREAGSLGVQMPHLKQPIPRQMFHNWT